jgi:hypothetical protein
MPGHMLAVECPCGLGGSVSPGVSARRGMALMVIAYDPGTGRLMTTPEDEAVKRGLPIFPDPFLNPGGGPGCVESPAFQCPRCGNRELRFSLEGFWD